MTTELAEASKQFMAAAERLPKIAPLYVLADEFNTLLDLVEDPQTDPLKLELQLAEVTSDIKAKAFGIAEVLRSFERRAEDYKREQDRLYAARKVLEFAGERLKAYTLEQMQSMGIDRIDTGVHTVRVQQNPPRVEVVDAALVPGEYQRTKVVVEVDKRHILEDVKDGVVVPGVSIERGVSLRIS